MNFKEKWQKKWNFEKKLNFVMGTAILILIVLAISLSAAMFVYTLSKRNNEYAREHLELMAEDCADNLNQYKALLISLVLDDSIQKYCEAKERTQVYQVMGPAYTSLLDVLRIQSNSNFAAVTNDQLQTYVYSGNISAQAGNFEESFAKDYAQSLPANASGSIRMSFSDCYNRYGTYTMTLYFPVYSLTQMMSSNGVLVINLNDSILERIQKKTSLASSSMYLTDQRGLIVSTKQEDRIGEQLNTKGRITGESGRFWNHGTLVTYRKVTGWNYYLVHEIPGFELYETVIQMSLLMLGAMLIVTVGVLVVTKKISGRLYRPFYKVISKMNDVSEGNLGARIHTIDTDSDSRKLAEGFNQMMDEIDRLMGQVKEEQQQIMQMELNALQSQIQPHFLYNTLECIHWQAVIDGSQNISAMVKALAQYYRICLSGGRDIIALETELAHVKSYLIIQNMRYDNIIELQMDVPEEFLGVQLPKLTLQPLVENSIYHGIRVKEGRKGTVVIRARAAGDDLLVQVQDDGEGMTDEAIRELNRTIGTFERTRGYGIHNVHKRLELLFGAGYGLKFYAGEKCGLTAEIRIPKEGGNDV